MQFVADAQQEVVAATKRREVVGRHIVLPGEFIDVRDVELHPRHPDGVLIIAQAADAVLDLRLLVENRVAVF